MIRLVSAVFTQLNEYDLEMEVDPKYQENPDLLQGIYVRPSTGMEVPLSSFTRFEPLTTALAVNHQGQFPAITPLRMHEKAFRQIGGFGRRNGEFSSGVDRGTDA